MIIIGEKINSTISSIKTAIENKEISAIQEIAKKQKEAGASYIDVNAGIFYEDEADKLEWLVNTVQEAVDTPLSIDSPNPLAVSKALKSNKNGKPIINSITAEKERYDSIVPLIVEYDTSVIALCMDDSGMPETVDQRVSIAQGLVENLTKLGLKLEDIYLDPMIRPVGTGSQYGLIALETMRKIRAEFPEVHITSGLSNISFGMPLRKLLNRTFLITAMSAGMDCAILDPLDKKLMSQLFACQTILGQDEFCMNYLGKFREGYLEI